MRQTKIKILGELYLPHINLLNYMKENHNLIEVDEEPDVLIFDRMTIPYTELKSYKCKKLLIIAENIFYSYERYKNPLIWHAYRMTKPFFINKLKLDLTLYLDKWFGKVQTNSFEEYKKYIMDIAEGKESNQYSIITNDTKAKNLLNIPYFITELMDRPEDLVLPDAQMSSIHKSKKKFCAFIVKNMYSHDRVQFCMQLSKYKKVDCYGPVLNNIKIPTSLVNKYLPDDRVLTEKEAEYCYHHGTYNLDRYLLNQELLRDYKFVICFENTIANDYVTEKLTNVMLANSIGIYKGAPNVGEFFNTKSFINFDDYRSNEAMIEKIIELDQDDEKYQEMLRQPFVVNNELPPRVKNFKKDLNQFLTRVFEIEC